MTEIKESSDLADADSQAKWGLGSVAGGLEVSDADVARLESEFIVDRSIGRSDWYARDRTGSSQPVPSWPSPWRSLRCRLSAVCGACRRRRRISTRRRERSRLRTSSGCGASIMTPALSCGS